MFFNNIASFFLIALLNSTKARSLVGKGMMMLARPKDITVDCAFSNNLRYDLSFGMGMSDTITVILRTLEDIDYECQVDITTDAINKVIAVIRFPTSIQYNCERNPYAFELMKVNQGFPICEEEHLIHQDRFSPYWILFTQGRFRFHFISNSSVNIDINAYFYEVTVTTARFLKSDEACNPVNETECTARNGQSYCFTSGVVCDGIKNCGTENWFDERMSECELPIQHLEYAPILAVLTVILCVFLAGAHNIHRCLPRTNSFFVYHNNEDNRFRIDPLFETPTHVFESNEVLNESSEYGSSEEDSLRDIEPVKSPPRKKSKQQKMAELQKIKSVSQIIQKRLRSVAGFVVGSSSSSQIQPNPSATQTVTKTKD